MPPSIPSRWPTPPNAFADIFIGRLPDALLEAVALTN
jgi:hypothetical protein